MDQGIISMRYAKALLRYAEENGEAERVYQETIKLGQTFQSLPALYKALLNPVLQEEKARPTIKGGCGRKPYDPFVERLRRFAH